MKSLRHTMAGFVLIFLKCPRFLNYCPNFPGLPQAIKRQLFLAQVCYSNFKFKMLKATIFMPGELTDL